MLNDSFNKVIFISLILLILLEEQKIQKFNCLMTHKVKSKTESFDFLRANNPKMRDLSNCKLIMTN